MASRRCSWRVITMRWVWLLPSQARVVTAVRFRGGTLPEPTGSGGALEHAVAYRLRHHAQVMGVLTSRHHRHRPARYMKGPPQVHRESIRGQRKRARRPCRPRLAQPAVLAWQRIGRAAAQAAQIRPVQGDIPIPAVFCRLPTDPVGHAWARAVGSPVIFPGLEETAGHRDSQEQAVR
jgi:hypothetical protein